MSRRRSWEGATGHPGRHVYRSWAALTVLTAASKVVAAGTVVEGATVVVDVAAGVAAGVVVVGVVLVDADVAGPVDVTGRVECTADEEGGDADERRPVEAFPPHALSANRGSATESAVPSR
jgi:hypothetical protein